MNNEITDKLKAHTLLNHQILEKSIIEMIKRIQSEKDYIRLMQIFYSYFGGLESLIKAYINSEKLPDNLKRRKVGLVYNDILSLGGVVPKILSKENLPLINNHFHAFGALYVLEGSTLGGSHIENILKIKYSIPESSLTFFRGYGQETVSMWNIFKVSLNELTMNENEVLQIISAADETFARFNQWINKNT